MHWKPQILNKGGWPGMCSTEYTKFYFFFFILHRVPSKLIVQKKVDSVWNGDLSMVRIIKPRVTEIDTLQGPGPVRDFYIWILFITIKCVYIYDVLTIIWKKNCVQCFIV